MPTGYTDAIKDGITFQTFALNCARAFGACLPLRDEPGGGEKIPEQFEPCDYHFKALAAARAELATLETMTSMECGFKAAAEHTEAEQFRLQRLKELDALRQGYEEMLACVQAWTPPTDDHVHLKEFMIQQITDSLKWDCDAGYYRDPQPELSGSEWLESAKSKAMSNIDYHKSKWADEQARTAERNAWVKALRDSL